MVLKSYAKINLSLSINAKLKTGLHNIQSIYCLINLNDKILVRKLKNNHSDKIIFSGKFSTNISKSGNSVKKILDVMRKNNLITDFYNIKIYKNIPVFAGLGGGTSNAATILQYLSKKRINKKVFNKIVKAVGSDLRLFFETQGYQKNLMSVVKLNKKYRLFFLLVFPKIKSSTKKIYSMVKKYSTKKTFLMSNLSSRKNFINYLKNSKNDLQSIVEKKHPIIRELLNNIGSTKGCYLSRMTGSGSACYGLFVDNISSKVALKKLRKKYPKFWFINANTI